MFVILSPTTTFLYRECLARGLTGGAFSGRRCNCCLYEFFMKLMKVRFSKTLLWILTRKEKWQGGDINHQIKIEVWNIRNIYSCTWILHWKSIKHFRASVNDLVEQVPPKRYSCLRGPTKAEFSDSPKYCTSYFNWS